MAIRHAATVGTPCGRARLPRVGATP